MFSTQQQALLQLAQLFHDPEPFLEVDFKKPFIYDPKWGVFYCPGGSHTVAMAALACLHLKFSNFEQAANYLGLDDHVYGLANYWLEHYHGCYKSSVSSKIAVWNEDSLEEWERTVISAAGRKLDSQYFW